MLNCVPSDGSSFWLSVNATHSSAYLPAFMSSRPFVKASSAGLAAAGIENASTARRAARLLAHVTEVLHGGLLLRGLLVDDGGLLVRGRGLLVHDGRRGLRLDDRWRGLL